LAEATEVGGEEYATIVSLAYRQTIGGGKLVWNENKKEYFFYPLYLSRSFCLLV
jgi:hypothetical protein